MHVNVKTAVIVSYLTWIRDTITHYLHLSVNWIRLSLCISRPIGVVCTSSNCKQAHKNYNRVTTSMYICIYNLSVTVILCVVGMHTMCCEFVCIHTNNTWLWQLVYLPVTNCSYQQHTIITFSLSPGSLP